MKNINMYTEKNNILNIILFLLHFINKKNVITNQLA